MTTLFVALAIVVSLCVNTTARSQKATIVLVHGAFADSSSWSEVVQQLDRDGYPVVAIANPLRGVRHDAEYLTDVLSQIETPVVLVGHSYGGTVISEAAAHRSGVKALVYVAGFAPEPGETAAQLSGRFPGSTLSAALARPVRLSAGGHDLYIQRASFRRQFAADVDERRALAMAAAQRPITEAALNEPQTNAAWQTLPAWFIYGERDLNIPAAASAYMAERARSRGTIVVKGASHALMVSHPTPVVRLIEQAAEASAQ